VRNIVFPNFVKVVLFSLMLINLAGCDFGEDVNINNYKINPYVYTETYNLIKVPVPSGGIVFPTGIHDDKTASIEKAFYIGEIPITNALWDTVARWAVEREYGYYYGLYHKHHEAYFNNGFYSYDEKKYNYYEVFNPNAPITQLFGYGYNAYSHKYIFITAFYVIPVWCNAFTEWYNEKYGTNLIPVYQDAYGNTIRFLNNSDIFVDTANPEATGFRLPSLEEWELAARWNDNSSTNYVTKTINGINFNEQYIKFTKGDSASGALFSGDYQRVAVHGGKHPEIVKTKEPNVLGLYDMSGNIWERTSSWHTVRFNSYTYIPTSRLKGGDFVSNQNEFAVGYTRELYWMENESIHDYVGFRVVRNAE